MYARISICTHTHADTYIYILTHARRHIHTHTNTHVDRYMCAEDTQTDYIHRYLVKFITS
jgi:hypothetical protein